MPGSRPHPGGGGFKLRTLALTALALGASFYYWAPAFYRLDATGWGDWQFFHHWWEVGVISITRHGELPLWDPYHCGGVTMWGNPQAQIYAPTFLLLALPFGTTIGSKLFVVLHMAVGLAGMFVFARQEYGLSGLSGAFAAAAWAGSGFFAWRGAGGHVAFLPFYFAPILLLAWRRSADSLRAAAAVALILALVLLEGGVYPFPFFLVLLAFDLVVRFATGGPRRGMVVGASVGIVLAALLGAVRLLPVMETLRRFPRQMPSTDAMTFGEVLDMLLLRDIRWEFPAHEFVWPEYVAYVGSTVLLLGIAGAFVALLRPGYRHLTIGALLFGAIMMGERGPFWPWSLLHRLPVYDSLRVPSRFSVFFTFFLALLAGLCLDRIQKAFARDGLPGRKLSFGFTLALVLAVVGVGDIVHTTRPVVNRWVGPPIDHRPAPEYAIRPLDSYGMELASLPRQNTGTVACYDGIEWPVSPALWTTGGPQAKLVDAAGRLESPTFTTNTIIASTNLHERGRIVFNQQFDPGWQTDNGRLVEDEGRLAVELPPGEHRVELRFRPESLRAAAVLGALGLIGCAATFFRRRQPAV